MSGEGNGADAFALQARGLGKAYRIFRSPARRLGEWLTFGALRGHDVHWGLQDLDFDLPRGQTLGVIGRNGSGKSTLLRLLAGVSEPSSGAYRTQGRISSLLELGTGFHPDATGRENVYGTAFLWGFRRGDLEQRMEEIVEFSELGAAIDDPVRTYSSGMVLRLGFSLAIASRPDVLLLDEVFAVGDLAFQKKCIDRIFAIKEEGRSIVFVSHSLYDVRLLCDAVLWLDKGRRRALGDPLEVTDLYQGSLEGRNGESLVPAIEGQPQLTSVALLEGGGKVGEVDRGCDLEVQVEWVNPTSSPVHLGIGFLREDTVLAFGLATYAEGDPLAGSRGSSTLRLPRLDLLPGRYLVAVWLLDEHGVHRWHEWPGEPLTIRGGTRELGIYAPERSWHHC